MPMPNTRILSGKKTIGNQSTQCGSIILRMSWLLSIARITTSKPLYTISAILTQMEHNIPIKRHSWNGPAVSEPVVQPYKLPTRTARD